MHEAAFLWAARSGRFPLYRDAALAAGVLTFTDVAAASKDVDVAVMVGGYPRKAGEERKDVMAKNVSIYKSQASALAENASKDVKVRSSVPALKAAEVLS
jgi:hypothetical protein